MLRLSLHGLICLLMLAAPAVWAETSERDLQVLARTLGFLDPPRSGTLRVGIVYDPAHAESLRLANRSAALLADPGLRIGSLELRGVLVPAADAAQAQVDLFLLEAGASAAGAQLPAVLRERRLPCLSTDLEQVRQGHCSIGIQSQPRVEILVNRSLAEASGLSFASVFRMMIREF